MGLAIAALIVNVFHVVGLLLFGSAGYRGRWGRLAADTVLYGMPVAVIAGLVLTIISLAPAHLTAGVGALRTGVARSSIWTLAERRRGTGGTHRSLDRATGQAHGRTRRLPTVQSRRRSPPERTRSMLRSTRSGHRL